MQHFRKTTLNKIVVMGRKTYDSIGQPLPKRTNIVLTNDRNLRIDGVIIYHDALQLKQDYANRDLYIIGGKSIYNYFMHDADQLIVSKIPGNFHCDTFMDPIDLTSFKLDHTVKHDGFTVEYYERID
jgi:dihydrofolate reductase